MIDILQTSPLARRAETWLAEHFRVHRLPREEPARAALLAEFGPSIRGIATVGAGPVDAALIAALPKLEIISSYTAGVDGIDVDAARAHGVVVTNTSAVLAETVAELGLALILMLLRGLGRADRFVRRGEWSERPFRLGRGAAGARLGIVGLGHIGKALAARAVSLRMEVAYHGPRLKTDSKLAYYANLVDLALWCDVLLLCCPGGDATHNLVDAEVLAALGAESYLVNLSRGSVVDEAALIEALARDAIAGAALDVFAHEPTVPVALVKDDRVVLLPHIGSATLETRDAMGRAMVQRLVERLS